MSDGWRFCLAMERHGNVYAGILAEGLENGEQDVANPDPALRTRPLLGSRLFDGLRYKISFHDYSPPASLVRTIEAWSAYGKPLLCTEYMARTQGSAFRDNLPVLRTHRVGAISWGLVSGKTQTIFPWGSRRGTPEPAIWFHDIFRPDGMPCDAAEVELLQKLTALES